MLRASQCAKFLKEADNKVQELADKSWDCMVYLGNALSICNQLTRTMKHMNQEADAYILGEIPMGISNEMSKLQVFLDLDRHMYYAARVYKDNLKDVKYVRDLIAGDPNWRIIRINYHLPSLQVYFRPTNETCEISVTNGLSVQLSEMIGHLFSIQPEAIKFYHFIRVWLKINQVRFKTFNIALLVIHFMQVHNFMPSAYRAQKNLNLDYIEGCVISFDKSKTLSDYGVNKLLYYYSFLRSFFRYYMYFNYESTVISTFYGYAMRKSDHPKLDHDTPMCLPAFINQQSNSAMRVGQSELNHFVQVCAESYDFLNSDF